MSPDTMNAIRARPIPYAEHRAVVIQYNYLLREYNMLQARQHRLEERVADQQLQLALLRRDFR